MILVTGGTGLVGAHLLLQLLKTEDSVKAIHRPSSDLDKVKKVFSYYVDNADELYAKIKWVVADITDIPALENAFIGVTHVYHCAALISFDPNDYFRLRRTNATGTANIVNFCLANSVEKLAYVSSIATIGKNENSPIVTEETDWNEADVNVYAITKYAAEMEVWRGTQEGLDAVIVNPGVILGPGYWNSGSGQFFSKTADGLKYYPPNGSGFIGVGDVVDMCIRLMKSDLKNQRYIAVAKNATFKEVLGKIATALGKPAPNKALKIWQLNILYRLDWLAHLLTRRGRKLSKMQVHGLKSQDIYENTKITTAIDFTYTDLDEVIKTTSSLFLQEQL
ncbi:MULTISPECIES: NAD-dependent epimerase/dehydratase family protein [unclassified Cellulophaga]|uniref:NAD-dependent epimerase/dehydratase family protein n=1 Tax=unclassified Cellulophaga TaxID=2634405 RepID=UPI0026E1DAA4|nr:MULTISPECIES: NAD-dependent epimerase/dehydratase family protein [unclassified Cellulophaga]MDO6492863.1 NAD-dependent epimerase/dehydratase family protein [Cellulophaga sp. 2_MG-2023]MDO6496365.1 NAD-dependent epimerase/dehydratase family protein [Cellulophaga sp. 3_MG-2023]